jgi:two-component sensor histidine kinase
VAGEGELNGSEGSTREAANDFRMLFETMSEGFALSEPIFDDDGQLIDYRFIQANPAFLRGFRGAGDILGRRFREFRPDATAAWFANFQPTLQTGVARRFQYHDRARGRWYQVHCMKVSADRFAHFYVDITALKRAEQHQADLLDELNHRVKNNLTIVASLLTLQGRGASPEVREHLEAAVGRIHTIADLHADLYRGARGEFVAMDQYLQDLANRLGASLASDRVKLVVDAEAVAVKLEMAVQLGLVVNELVTNAIKHAYPEPEHGVVTIRLAAAGSTLLLTVSDYGRGLPAEGGRRGLGSRVVNSFVQQCGGSLTIIGSPGATFEIRAPWRPPDSVEPQSAPLI